MSGRALLSGNLSKDALLLHLLDDDPQLGTELRIRNTKQIRASKQSESASKFEDRRTVGELLSAAEELTEEKRCRAAEKAAAQKKRLKQEMAAAREKYLDDLAQKADQAWLDEYVATSLTGDQRADDREIVDILAEAISARNGWKRILKRCSP